MMARTHSESPISTAEASVSTISWHEESAREVFSILDAHLMELRTLHDCLKREADVLRCFDHESLPAVTQEKEWLFEQFENNRIQRSRHLREIFGVTDFDMELPGLLHELAQSSPEESARRLRVLREELIVWSRALRSSWEQNKALIKQAIGFVEGYFEVLEVTRRRPKGSAYDAQGRKRTGRSTSSFTKQV